jgi:hypothetical protein
MTDRRGTPLCQEHVYLANQEEMLNDDIKHIAWLIRDILEADGATTKAQVENGDVAPEFCMETVDTIADGLVIRLADGSAYEVAIRRIE